MKRIIHHDNILGKRSSRCWCKECQKKERIKASCQRKVHNHLIKLAMKVLKIKCAICGSPYYVIAHHPDYNKPFCVLWVCISCHIHIHAGRLTFTDEMLTNYENTMDSVIKNIKHNR